MLTLHTNIHRQRGDLTGVEQIALNVKAGFIGGVMPIVWNVNDDVNLSHILVVIRTSGSVTFHHKNKSVFGENTMHFTLKTTSSCNHWP